ncbi:MAG: nucleoside triphosphate pyrophosphohydrolase family protein [Candidatus Colwellbacteria bacterium]|nr:nucleoside triphosphate pyrophosphohydrolase family protein [Candidatus Colwellbacteria bacterium]
MSFSHTTDFQNVTEFNRLFGNKTYITPRLDIFDTDPKTVTACLALINEEHKELVEAIETKDFTETIDALADLIVVIGGMACRFGIDLDKASEIVHKSNMSKLCTSEEEAQKTVEWYKENEKRYDSPYYEIALDGVHYVVRNRSTGKILKNMNYTPANFESLTKSNIISRTVEKNEDGTIKSSVIVMRGPTEKELEHQKQDHDAQKREQERYNQLTMGEKRCEFFVANKQHIKVYHQFINMCHEKLESWTGKDPVTVQFSECTDDESVVLFFIQEELSSIPKYKDIKSSLSSGDWSLTFTRE